MPRSMTGFGKAAGSIDGQEVSVELSSVNHRYLDVGLRLPNGWAALEPVVKQHIRKRIGRGKLTLTISRKRTAGSSETIRFDAETAQQYIKASEALRELLGTDDSLSLNVLAQLEGVFTADEPDEDLDSVQERLLGIITDALARLDTMREGEGRMLVEDVRTRIGYICEALATVEERLPELNSAHETRLRARLEDLGSDLALTEDRIAMEVALLADKADVTEEVVRLKSHLEHMAQLLDSEEPVGRRLDFLLQELQREVNTLGVKTRDSDVAKEVLAMKSELEKIREQVQNIE